MYLLTTKSNFYFIHRNQNRYELTPEKKKALLFDTKRAAEQTKNLLLYNHINPRKIETIKL